MDTLKEIINFAYINSDINYVIQNGSRVNPSVIVDKYADYDIILGCNSPQIYVEDQSWIEVFGEILILQLNHISSGNIKWPIFLMQFKNGTRIDVQFYPGDPIKKYKSDSLSKIILDKYNIFIDQFIPNESTYFITKPQIIEYEKAINEFWWCIINVGKGLARNELTYSTYMYETIVRDSFLKIISWYISSKNNWKINTGKFGKFIEKYCETDLWKKIRKTYKTNTNRKFWKAVFSSCQIIEEIDNYFHISLGYNTRVEDYSGIYTYLTSMKKDKKIGRTTTASS